MKRLGMIAFILALVLCFVMPASAVKIAPYNMPLHDIMTWDKFDTTLRIANPENEAISVSWPEDVDLWNYDGDQWKYNLPDGDEFLFLKGVNVGDEDSVITYTQGEPILEVWGTCASTSGAVTAMPVYIMSILTGTGAVGRGMEVVLAPTALMGGWGNAIKAKLDMSGHLGSIGLLAGLCAEVVTPAGALNGSVAVVEHEIVVTAGYTAGAHVGYSNILTFMQFALSGNETGKNYVNDYAQFMTIYGLTAGATHLLSADSVTLKGSVNNSAKYLVLSTHENMLRFSNTTTDPNVADGVGTTISVVGTFAGTSTGSMGGLASWINVDTGADFGAGGYYLAAVQTGIWEGAATDIGEAKVIFGMRMHKLLTDTPDRACPFSLNTDNTGITAIFDVQTRTDLSDDDADGESYTADGWIPFFVDVGGNIRYIRTYR